jgi:hypothetical protein
MIFIPALVAGLISATVVAAQGHSGQGNGRFSPLVNLSNQFHFQPLSTSRDLVLVP